MYSISFLENCFNNENPMLFCKEKSVINLVWLPFKICTSLFMPNPNSRLSTHKSSIFYNTFFIFIYSLCKQFIIILYRHNTLLNNCLISIIFLNSQRMMTRFLLHNYIVLHSCLEHE